MSIEDAVGVSLILAVLCVCSILVVSVIEMFRQGEHKRRMERAAVENTGQPSPLDRHSHPQYVEPDPDNPGQFRPRGM